MKCGLFISTAILGVVEGLHYYASCAKGLEKVLAQEISSPLIGGTIVEVSSRGVAFKGDQRVGYAAITESRIANRISEEIGFFSDIHTREDVYALGRSIDWKRMLHCDMTVSVETRLGQGVASGLRHSHFSSLTLKNALVDSFRERLGARPSVDARNADLPLSLYLHRGDAILFRSLTSGSLHKRGYRGAMHAASLRESVAAGCLALARSQSALPSKDNVAKADDDFSVLVDPMCGSGTLPIEAALIALHVAPGLVRYTREANPSCLSWLDADLAAWRQVITAAKARVKSEPDFAVVASDNNPAALALTRRDARAAGVDRHMHIVPEPTDAADFTLNHILSPDACKSIVVVSNPPWGQRLGGADDSWTSMGSFLRRHPGSSASLLCANTVYSRQLRLRKSASHSLSSGGTDFKLLHYKIFPSSPDSTSVGRSLKHQKEERRKVADCAGATPIESTEKIHEDRLSNSDGDLSQLDGLTVVALKARLRHHGLKVSGRKQDLIDRLQEHHHSSSFQQS